MMEEAEVERETRVRVVRPVAMGTPAASVGMMAALVDWAMGTVLMPA
jgi:hypothetical protein